MNKLEKLKEIRERINFSVSGNVNINLKEPCIFVSNHNCLLDIFYQPMALDIPIISLVSARLIYKNILDRQQIINDYLYSMPIEAHGGKVYSDMCLNSAVKLLNSGLSLGIFPEGAYVSERCIYRGRTGVSRILFEAKKMGINVNLVPISINITGDDYDLDSYKFDDRKVEVKILPGIDYENAYDYFLYANSADEKNNALHEPVDLCMKAIAEALDCPYKDEYIELYQKGNVIFNDGKTVLTSIAQDDMYISSYQKNLDKRAMVLKKQLFEHKF